MQDNASKCAADAGGRLRVGAAAGQAMLGLHGALSLLGAGMRGKPRRGMLRRAVFSDFQRKGLEKVFQKQKYISKPDRKKLAEKLGLKDSQVIIIMMIIIIRRRAGRQAYSRERVSNHTITF